VIGAEESLRPLRTGKSNTGGLSTKKGEKDRAVASYWVLSRLERVGYKVMTKARGTFKTAGDEESVVI